eukprot:g14604.t1
MGEFQRWNTHHSHVVPIEVCGHQLNIAQDPTSDNLGTTIWDASVILVRYMERNPQLYSRRKLEGKRVLELGAGCGLAGMFFALQGAHVTFTDLIEVVPLLQRNVTMNLGGQAVEHARTSHCNASDKEGKASAAATCPKAKVLEYDWGKPLDGLSPPYDYVIACDCVYVERLVESLVWSMTQCSGRSTTVLVASEKREEITYAKFRERLSEDFAVRQAPRRHMDKAYDHENSEVLLCKLRRTNNKEGGRVDGRDKSEGIGGQQKEGASCVAEQGTTGQAVSAAAAGHRADGESGAGAKTPCPDQGDAVSAYVGPAAADAAATAATIAEAGLSLAGVSLSPSLPSSAAGESESESVEANGSSPNGGATLTTVADGTPHR